MSKEWASLSKSPIQYASKLSDKKVLALLDEADTAYHNGQSVIDDNTYDMLVTYIEERMGQKRQKIGADVTHGKKVKLPLHMGSMDKVKPDTNKLKNWLKTYTGPYVLSDKLDGISLLVEYKKGKLKHIYTRGNGTIGSDVSGLKRYLKVPTTLLNRNGVDYFRGELIISKENWPLYAKEGYKNPRNTASGLINGLVSGKTIKSSLLKLLDFVVFDHTEHKRPTDPIVSRKLEDGLRDAQLVGFTVVEHVLVRSLTLDLLSEMLLARRAASPFEIDGVIVSQNTNHPVKTSGNPDHAVAFKMLLDDQRAESFVQYVEWNVSKSGLLKPVVNISPVTISGTTIHRVTGYNARWIRQNKIGPGAQVVVIKSGDVIPKIVSVTRAAVATQYPNGNEDTDWEWDGEVDIRVKGDSDDMNLKKLLYFSNTLEIEGLKEGTLKKLYAAKFDTIPKVLKLTEANITALDGFQSKSAKSLVQNIQLAYHTAPRPLLYAALGIFGEGVGYRKIKLLVEHIPNICTKKIDETQLVEKITKINGFGLKSAHKIIPHVRLCQTVLKSLPKQNPLIQRSTKSPANTIVIRRDIEGNKFVFTGIRSKNVEKAVVQHGATVSSTVSKHVTVLVAKDPKASSAKIKKARALGIPIQSMEEFIQWLIEI
jgi:NAD-dependent DNA ligase